MRRRLGQLLGILALLATYNVLRAADPPVKLVPAPIKFPTAPTTPDKPPAPVAPDAPLMLLADTVLVVESDGPMLAFVTIGALKVEKADGPLRFRAKFYGGNGKHQTKTFASKHLLLVESLGQDATLMVLPSGCTDEKLAVVKRITANEGPRPPPPDPKPEPIPTAKAVYIAAVRDPGQVTPSQARLLGDTAFWDSLKASGHEWDFYANTSPEAAQKGYLRVAESVQVAGSGYTAALVVLDKQTGQLLKVVKLPADKAGVVAVLKEVVK